MAFLVSFSRGESVAGLAIVAADTAAPTSELVVSDIQIVGPHLHPLPGERQKLWSIMFTTTGAKREGLGSKARLKCEAFGGSTAPSGDAKIWAAVGRVALSSSRGLLDSPQTSRLGSLEDDAASSSRTSSSVVWKKSA